MLESKRKFKRFDLPLIVKFRPAIGKTQYSLGLLKNISWEGLSLEAREFNFVQHENLELELKFPQGNSSLSLLGDVMWNRQDGNISYAGIKFQGQNEITKNEIIENISSHANIPVNSFLNKDIYQKSSDKKTSNKPAAQKKTVSQETEKPGLVKKYLVDSSKCRVTFRLPIDAAPNAQTVLLVGDFNNWDTAGTKMIKLKGGDFSISLDLDCDKEYRFKYLVDGHHWENDWNADKYVPNSFGSDDSVVIT